MSRGPRASTPVCITFPLAGIAAILMASAVAGQTLPQAAVADPAQRGGIWKAVVPPRRMQGEFDDHDPLGVAAGARIKADCSLNWTDPDDGKLYCFSSGTSLEIFLERPQWHITRARQVWQSLTAATH